MTDSRVISRPGSRDVSRPRTYLLCKGKVNDFRNISRPLSFLTYVCLFLFKGDVTDSRVISRPGTRYVSRPKTYLLCKGEVNDSRNISRPIAIKLKTE